MSAARSDSRAVAALVHVGELAAAVEEHGDRVVGGRLDRLRDVLVGVEVGRVGQRRRRAGSGARDRVESPALTPRNATFLPFVDGLLLEDRELGAAGGAPRGPLVDHDGVALERREALAERLRPPASSSRGLLVQRGQRRRRAGQLALGLARGRSRVARGLSRRRPGVSPTTSTATSASPARMAANRRIGTYGGRSVDAVAGLCLNMRCFPGRRSRRRLPIAVPELLEVARRSTRLLPYVD